MVDRKEWQICLSRLGDRQAHEPALDGLVFVPTHDTCEEARQEGSRVLRWLHDAGVSNEWRILCYRTVLSGGGSQIRDAHYIEPEGDDWVG